MECQCDNNTPDDAAAGWLNGSSFQMGTFTVVGYLLYRFSQTLPALIRWPIRLFCSITGLSTLWSWVSRLVGTLRGIQSLCKWLSRVWKFLVAFSSKFQWLVRIIEKITGSSDDAWRSKIDPTSNSGLRLILLGPTSGGRTILADILLANSDKKDQTGPITESTQRKTLINGEELTVIITADILGPSLGNNTKAREALRSLQLASPGPHALLLMIQVPSLSMDINQGAAEAIQATRKLFGDESLQYILPVLTYADDQGQKQTAENLLKDESLRRALSLCNQRPEVVDTRLDGPLEEQRETCRQLVERVKEMKTLRGHFMHELQRRENQRREELLAEMTSALEKKLGHM